MKKKVNIAKPKVKIDLILSVNCSCRSDVFMLFYRSCKEKGALLKMVSLFSQIKILFCLMNVCSGFVPGTTALRTASAIRNFDSYTYLTLDESCAFGIV